jgi:hypothetical protein
MKATDVIREHDLVFWLKEFGEHLAEEFIHELRFLRAEVDRLKRQVEYGFQDAYRARAVATQALREQLARVTAERDRANADRDVALVEARDLRVRVERAVDGATARTQQLAELKDRVLEGVGRALEHAADAICSQCDVDAHGRVSLPEVLDVLGVLGVDSASAEST